MTEDVIIFSHGDLHLKNILVDADCNITGVVDWGSAGFSIPGRDFLDANLRARKLDWITMLADIFPEEVKVEYDVLKELNRALVLYSGFLTSVIRKPTSIEAEIVVTIGVSLDF